MATLNTVGERWKQYTRRLHPRPPGEGGGRAPSRARQVMVPTILQMEAVECGAACLAMVLAHYGRHVPLDELRVACGVSRDGSKASNLLRAGRAYGLIARGYQKELEQLRQMRLPVILHWNLNHFVVLEGFGRGRAYIKDPSRGAVSVPEEELDRAFTGIVLAFEPGPEFQRGGSQPSLAGSLRPRLAGAGMGLFYVVLTGLALLVPGMVVPAFSRVFVDSVLVKGLESWMAPLLLLIGATLVVQALLVWLQQHYLLRLETQLALRSSGQFFWHVLRLPLGFFLHRSAGEISNRVGIGDRVARLLSEELASTALDLLLIAFYAALMVQYDVVLTAIGVGTAALNLAALKYTSRKRLDLSQELLKERGQLTGAAMGGLQTIETLKATGSESDFFARWAGHLARMMNSQQRVTLTLSTLSRLPVLLLNVNVALVLGIGGLRVMDGKLSIGMLLAFEALLLAFVGPVNRIVNVGSTVKEVEGGLQRLDDVLQAGLDPCTGESPEHAPEPTLAKLSGHVELRNVTFGFNRLEPPLIQGFNLTLEPGSRVALVGRSGSGKTTVAKLVAGLYTPWEGEILFDGKPRAEIPREVVNSSLAMVEQDVFLFEGTVRDNLTLWDPTTPEEDLLDAARDACIYDEIASRPGGYSSLVEEGGRNFSGGQRQRMEIARALSGRPTIVVLDEATSALDPATEKRIDDNLRRRGCTCLIVAHRLSTIRDCDEIIVMDRGEIVQRGTHEELYHQPGPYRDLIENE
jgi:NHLM bacteriocin system ABC transporter peptidase/ATP-binding protein